MIWEWLEKEPNSFTSVIAIMAGTICTLLVYNSAIVHAMQFSETASVAHVTNPSMEAALTRANNFLWAAMKEEVWRLWILAIAVRASHNNPRAVSTMTLATAIWFASWHFENPGYTIASSLLLQGFGGFMFNLVYLKCGGLNEKIVQGFACSVITHTGWNMLMLAMDMT